MSVFKYILSFETTFVLWLFSYQYKNAYGIFSSPDITILLTLILVPWGSFLLFKNRNERHASFLDLSAFTFFMVSLWFIVSSAWSPSHIYMLQKTLCYAVYTIPAFIIGYLVISQSQERIKRLLTAVCVFSVLVLMESYRVFLSNGLASISDVLNTNYLVTGQTLGVGMLIIISYSYFFFQERNTTLKHHVLWFSGLLLSGLFFYVMINLGGRGPVLATAITLMVFYVLRGWQDSPTKPSVHFGGLALLCMISYFILNGLFDHAGSHFEQRISPLVSGQIDEAVNERFQYYQSAYQIFLQHPIYGAGFGGWPMTHGLGDVSLHPHNIFLEIMSETGIIGLLLFLLFLYAIFRNWDYKYFLSKPERTSAALLALFSFINAQKTGDLHDNLLLFFALSLCAGMQHLKGDQELSTR